MGFPTWTLWGMGLAAVAALITIALAFIAQTPRLVSRLGLAGARLDLRARNFTGYGLAFLLLAMGFYIAGVPLGATPSAAELPNVEEPIVAGTIVGDVMDQAGPVPTVDVQDAITALGTDPTATRPSNSGAMGGLGVPTLSAELPGEGTPEAGTEIANSPDDIEGTPTTPPDLLATPEPTAVGAGSVETAVPPTATPTSTPEPTQTPSPTPSPTPIVGPTARINDNTSTLSIRKTPGGDPLVQVVRGDTVLLLSGHAFHGGSIWQEISTVNGVAGWVQEQFLDYSEVE